MQLTVVLLNWRHSELTVRRAQSLRSWTTIKPTIVVVDNESTAASRELLAAASVDTLIHATSNLGYGGGNNLGIRASSPGADSIVLLLNSDSELTEAAALQLLARFDADPGLSILGPLLIEEGASGVRAYAGGRDIARFPRTRTRVDTKHLRELPSYPLPPVDYVPGTVFLARRSAFDHVGLLDEDYFFSGEIADFCRRARDAGHDMRVDLDAEARHETGSGVSGLRDTLYVYYSVRNRFLYVRKYYSSAEVRYNLYWSMIAAGMAARATLRGRFGRARAILLAWADGLSGRFGNQNAKFL